MNNNLEIAEGRVTEAITLFGLDTGELISAVFDGGSIAHKEALRKIFEDALREVNRRLENN